MVAILDRLRGLRVADVMSREVVLIHAHQTMGEAARVLLEHQISGAPVADEQGKCVGVLSASDFVGRARVAGELVSTVAACDKVLAREAPHGPWLISDAFDDRVAARMTPAMQAVTAQAPVVKAARIMRAQHVHRLPVLDSQGRALGMITSSDIIAAFLQALDEAEPKPGKARVPGAAGQTARSPAPPPAIDELQREHIGLRNEIEVVRTAIESEKDQARLVALLEEFARHAEDHFRQEERGDCFAQAASRAPWLADRITAVLAEHAQLREQVREVVRLAAHAASRDRLAERFDALVILWLAHETAENDLLLDAYNQDLGIED